MKKDDFFEVDRFIDEEIEKLSRRSVSKKKKQKNAKTDILSDSLEGKCLVHIGNEGGELYHQAVIYVTECRADIVKGIMINKLLFGTAQIECKAKDDNQDDFNLRQVYEDLYQGGPENPAHGYVLFPKEDKAAADPYAEIHGNIAVSTSFGVLQNILDGEGPLKKIIAMGHYVWHRGELEWEIFNNQWLIIPGTEDIIFDTAFEKRWERAKSISGVDLNCLIPSIGLA